MDDFRKQPKRVWRLFIRKMKIPADETSILRDAMMSKSIIKKAPDMNEKWNRHIVQQLGGMVPAEVFAAPIISAGKVVAVLYGDNVPETSVIGDTTALEIFLAQAGIAMDRALLERKLRDLRLKDEERSGMKT